MRWRKISIYKHNIIIEKWKEAGRKEGKRVRAKIAFIVCRVHRF
ncbi:hypothetical protein B4168_3454 [Anoxybacillus flavithermus]|nr:hypothetical protein B4168_3454 [Anoxybacillus flavithermus]OAO84552.1 hypothetical protein GT23_3403 [Parageobacillus thermoglucosidasius]